MLKNYTQAQYRTITEYELTFDDGHNNGFGFSCDKSGKLLDNLAREAIENYHHCMDHPEKYARFNEVIRFDRKVKDNAHGLCSCGNDVELYDAYYGASQCDRCGQWYNLCGQELLAPEYWEHDPADED